MLDVRLSLALKLPFTISAEAEHYIRVRLEHAPPSGMEPSLNRGVRLKVHDKHGKLIERYDGEHYFIGYSSPNKHAGHSRLQLFGHTVAIHPRSLESLNGKRLTIDRTDQLEEVECRGEILVAREGAA